MSQLAQQVEEILDRLVRDVEASLHAFYRGDHRQNTVQTRSDGYRREAAAALVAMIGAGGARPGGGSIISGSGPAAGASVNSAMLTPEEVAAITRCIMAWLPMGAPADASAQSRCVAAAKELAPSWGEREKARTALKRASS